MTATPNKTSWQGPSLAIAVAAACALMVVGVEAQKAQSSYTTAASVPEAPASIREVVARAVEELSKLERDMEQFTERLCQENVPEHLVMNQPFGLVAENLRFAERAFRSVDVPDGMKNDYVLVLRALAKARSVAATNDSLIRQITTIPETYESEVNLDALKKLADHTTRRLGELVS